MTHSSKQTQTRKPETKLSSVSSFSRFRVDLRRAERKQNSRKSAIVACIASVAEINIDKVDNMRVPSRAEIQKQHVLILTEDALKTPILCTDLDLCRRGDEGSGETEKGAKRRKESVLVRDFAIVERRTNLSISVWSQVKGSVRGRRRG